MFPDEVGKPGHVVGHRHLDGLASLGIKGAWRQHSASPAMLVSGLPVEVISYMIYLYFRFPLSLRMVEEMLAVRGIEVSRETVRKLGSEVWP
jgi:outer membrane receptor for Fe3+-dicitrate